MPHNPTAAHKSHVNGKNECGRNDPEQEAEGDVDAVEEDKGGSAGAVRLLAEVAHVQLFTILKNR